MGRALRGRRMAWHGGTGRCGCVDASALLPVLRAARCCCEMHVSHALHMHEPGTDARIWTCDVWWAAHTGAAHICNIVWCICLSNRRGAALACVHMHMWPALAAVSAYGHGLILPRSACLRLILLCTCLPLRAGALWPMPAWVWRDALIFFSPCFFSSLKHSARHVPHMHLHCSPW